MEERKQWSEHQDTTAEIIQQEAKGERSERLGEGTEPSLGSKVNSLCKNKENLYRELRGKYLLGKGMMGSAGEKVGLYGCSLDTEQMFQGNSSMDENEELDRIRGWTGQFGDDICKIQDVSPDISSSVVQNTFLDGREKYQMVGRKEVVSPHSVHSNHYCIQIVSSPELIQFNARRPTKLDSMPKKTSIDNKYTSQKILKHYAFKSSEPFFFSFGKDFFFPSLSGQESLPSHKTKIR